MMNIGLDPATTFFTVGYGSMTVIAYCAAWSSARAMDETRQISITAKRNVKFGKLKNQNMSVIYAQCIEKSSEETRAKLRSIGEIAAMAGMFFTLSGIYLGGQSDGVSTQELISTSIGTTIFGSAISIVTTLSGRRVERVNNELQQKLLPSLDYHEVGVVV